MTIFAAVHNDEVLAADEREHRLLLGMRFSHPGLDFEIWKLTVLDDAFARALCLVSSVNDWRAAHDAFKNIMAAMSDGSAALIQLERV